MSIHNKFSLIVILGVSFLLTSCAKTKEEEVLSAVREARYFLNSSQCQAAQDALEDIGQQKDDAAYVATYASALACKGGYSDLDITSNFSNIQTGAGFLGSFATFTSSNETAVDAVTYTSLLESIDYIITADVATGGNPETVKRLTNFGRTGGNDLSMQALFMTVVALGKYIALYGNTDATGKKGTGTFSNTKCMAGYDNALIVAGMAVPGAGKLNLSGCDEPDKGHPELLPANAKYKRRLCEGIILFNNLLDILGNIQLSGNSSLGNLDDVFDALDDVLNNSGVAIPGLSTIITNTQKMRSLTACEDAAVSADDLQIYFGIILENGLSI